MTAKQKGSVVTVVYLFLSFMLALISSTESFFQCPYPHLHFVFSFFLRYAVNVGDVNICNFA